MGLLVGWTLALAAMTYSVAFRWTAVTGGEDGLGGIKRPLFGGIDFEHCFTLAKPAEKR